MKDDARAAMPPPEAWVSGLVSVIIPTRNRPQLLARALSHVKAQTHPSLEVIIVDDGSSDECRLKSLALMQDANPPVRVLYIPDDTGAGAGPARARNRAMAQAQGEFIAFCDDDDEWLAATHLSDALDAFRRQPDLDLYFSNQIALRDGQLEYDVWMPLLHHKLGDQRLAGKQPIPISKAEALCAPGDFAHMNSCVIRRSLLKRTGPFWSDVRYVEDLDMFLRWADAARAIAYNPRPNTRHHIPNRDLKASASTRLPITSKYATINLVAWHLLRTCATREAQGYARRLGMNACMNLSALHRREGKLIQATAWAGRALVWRCHLKSGRR